MVRKLFGFKQQLWGKKKQETPNVTVLKYVQYSEFDDTKYGTVQFDSNTTNNNNNNDNRKQNIVDNKRKEPVKNTIIKSDIVKPTETVTSKPEIKRHDTSPIITSKSETTSIVNTNETLEKQALISKELPSASASSSNTNTHFEDDTQKTSTLIHMTESSELFDDYKVHVVQYDTVSTKSEDSYESADTLEAANYINKEYSSQAASIFFADDSDTEESKNMHLMDTTSQRSQTSA